MYCKTCEVYHSAGVCPRLTEELGPGPIQPGMAPPQIIQPPMAAVATADLAKMLHTSISTGKTWTIEDTQRVLDILVRYAHTDGMLTECERRAADFKLFEPRAVAP